MRRLSAENKYNSRKTACSFGHLHDSKREARRCGELHILQQAGQISDLEIQRKYELIPAQYMETGEFYKKGDKIGQPKLKEIERACCYVADFVYTQDGIKYIEDCKGHRTKDYIIKRKLMRYRYCDDKTLFIET